MFNSRKFTVRYAPYQRGYRHQHKASWGQFLFAAVLLIGLTLLVLGVLSIGM